MGLYPPPKNSTSHSSPVRKLHVRTACKAHTDRVHSPLDSPLGHGWLVDTFDYASPSDFAPTDFRANSPKFQGTNFYTNKAIVEEIKKLAKRKGCTTAQVALAWVAAQGMIAIPGTTKVGRLEENWGSRDVVLSEEEMGVMRRIVDGAKIEGERNNVALTKLVGH